MFTDVIILAGGFGERLWPASRPDNPKQFLSLGNNISLLQNSILRALALKIEGKIIIATINLFNWLSFIDISRYRARKIVKKILPNSDGWTPKSPIPSQLLAPFTYRPKILV